MRAWELFNKASEEPAEPKHAEGESQWECPCYGGQRLLSPDLIYCLGRSSHAGGLDPGHCWRDCLGWPGTETSIQCRSSRHWDQYPVLIFQVGTNDTVRGDPECIKRDHLALEVILKSKGAQVVSPQSFQWRGNVTSVSGEFCGSIHVCTAGVNNKESAFMTKGDLLSTESC